MRTDEFMEQVYTPEIREYIIRTARAKTKSLELQEDAMQEAFLDLSQEPAGRASGYYQAVAYRAINRTTMKEQRFQRRQGEIRERMVTRMEEGLPKYSTKKVRVRVKKRG